MHAGLDIGVDIDHLPHLGVTGTGRIGLAHKTGAHGDQQVAFVHGIIAAEGSL